MPLTRTYHDEPAFLTAFAFIVEMQDLHAGRFDIGDIAKIGMAHCEFTDDDSHLPAERIRVEVANGAQGLADLDQALGELVAASTDLSTTLRLLRTRDLVREVKALT